ncbi:MAG: hypothetical protein NT075_24055 [Chloroflexi bacterium]|nr:hypothetical protein [Chloroflexota bacterium]
MKKLFTKTLLLIGLVFLTYLGLFLLPNKPTLLYASILDKHQLLQRAGSPKIVFVGGSSLALGLDSAMIQAQTGLPVVNMGLNGGLGLRYMLEEIKPDITAGDLVIISPEYEHWYGSLLDGDLNLWWIMQVQPGFSKFISSQLQVETLLKYLPEFMQEKFLALLPAKIDPVYNRTAFNQYGDFVNHLTLTAPAHLAGIKQLKAEPYNSQTLAVLQSFTTFASQRGANTLFIFPPLAKTQFTFKDNQAAIQQLYTLVKQLPAITVLGTPEDFVFPDQLFFDTVYHLRAEGRTLRTTRMSEMLLQALAREHSLRKPPLASAP